MSPPPALHDLVATVCAPTSVFSGADGQIRAAGVQGMLHADVRVLSEAVLRLDGHEPEPVGHAPAGPGGTVFVSVAHPPGGPAIRIERTRRVVPGGLTEQVVLTSDAAPIAATVTLDLAADFAPIATVRSGGIPAPVPPGTWRHSGIAVTVTGDRSRAVRIAPGEPVVLRWEVRVEDAGAVVHAPAGPVEWSRPVVRADDHRLARLVDRALDDLAGLRLGDGGADTYLGAGVPWYLTLFGRDSLWAARMLLPLGTGLAAGTLRVLARRQGARVDPVTGEAPGKILHELRRDEFMLAGSGLRLPAAYYGTVDATLLWISLLHDTWRWGHPAAEVAALLPALEAALGWLSDHADPDGDGFLEYVDTSGHGLANQGWKDSGDAVRFRDGRIAEPPIALAEVQGYAHRAALDGAALLDAFGRPGGERWRAYADGLAGRFRAAFWVDGGYPALALDRDKRPVDSLTSNIGHLLGTGLLSDAEERAVADALADPSMSGGFGLRTMSAADRGFDPLSYHCGSVWAHDTAIVVAGLARAGFGDAAATLIDGLLAAGAAFDFRLPELHAGFARDGAAPPTAYPSACRPQAWSAAAAVLIVQAVLGLEPDVPAGTVRLRPPAGAPLGAIEVRGLRIGGESVDVAVDPAGRATITGPATGG